MIGGLDRLRSIWRAMFLKRSADRGVDANLAESSAPHARVERR
jgi:hypothetical protein